MPVQCSPGAFWDGCEPPCLRSVFVPALSSDCFALPAVMASSNASEEGSPRYPSIGCRIVATVCSAVPIASAPCLPFWALQNYSLESSVLAGRRPRRSGRLRSWSWPLAEPPSWSSRTSMPSCCGPS